MGSPRNTYKYEFKIGNKIVRKGMTRNLERRERELRSKWPQGHIRQIGRQMTTEAARRQLRD